MQQQQTVYQMAAAAEGHITPITTIITQSSINRFHQSTG
jgi:hypothetical protein